jgi:membrane-associated phospholipid phosphatase
MNARAEKLLISCIMGLVLPLVFAGLATIAPRGNMNPILANFTVRDSALPFLPGFVWLYISWYLAPALLLQLAPPVFRRGCMAGAGAFALCCLGYVLLPMEIARPVPDTSWSGSALRILYGLDPPVNLFPSFHAALIGVLLVFVRPRGRLWRWSFWLWMALICIACVATKQHYLVDVIAGGCVGVLSAASAKRTSSPTLSEARLVPGGAPTLRLSEET